MPAGLIWKYKSALKGYMPTLPVLTLSATGWQQQLQYVQVVSKKPLPWEVQCGLVQFLGGEPDGGD